MDGAIDGVKDKVIVTVISGISVGVSLWTGKGVPESVVVMVGFITSVGLGEIEDKVAVDVGNVAGIIDAVTDTVGERV